MLLVTVGLVMALMMAFGAGAAFADRGGGGHFACDETGCHASGGFGGPDGGFGNNFTNDFSELEVTISGGSGGPGGGFGSHFTNDFSELEVTISGGSGAPGGGEGGRCEFEYLPGEDETGPLLRKEAGSRDCSV